MAIEIHEIAPAIRGMSFPNSSIGNLCLSSRKRGTKSYYIAIDSRFRGNDIILSFYCFLFITIFFFSSFPLGAASKQISVFFTSEKKSEWFVKSLEEGYFRQGEILETARLAELMKLSPGSGKVKFAAAFYPGLLKTADLINSGKLPAGEKFLSLLFKKPGSFSVEEREYFYGEFTCLAPYDYSSDYPLLSGIRQRIEESDGVSPEEEIYLQAVQLLSWARPYLETLEEMAPFYGREGMFSEEELEIIRAQVSFMFSGFIKDLKNNILEGRIEPAIMPFYDMNLDLVSMSEGLGYPEDTETSLVKSIEIYAGYFGVLPRGIFLSHNEGSSTVLETFRKMDLKWAVNPGLDAIYKNEDITVFNSQTALDGFIESLILLDRPARVKEYKRFLQAIDESPEPALFWTIGKSDSDFRYYRNFYLQSLTDCLEYLADSGEIEFILPSRFFTDKAFGLVPDDETRARVILENSDIENISRSRKARKKLEQAKNSGEAGMVFLDKLFTKMYFIEEAGFYRSYTDENIKNAVSEKAGQIAREIEKKTGPYGMSLEFDENRSTEVVREFAVRKMSSGFVINDFTGDDFGPGEYLYPDNALLEKGMFDLVSFGLEAEKENYVFSFEMGRTGNPYNLPNGFSPLYLETYIDINRRPGAGFRKIYLDGRMTAASDSAWEYCLKFSGSKGELMKFTGKTAYRIYELKQEDLTVSSNTVRIEIPGAHFSGNMNSWGYMVLVSAQVPETGEAFTVGMLNEPLPVPRERLKLIDKETAAYRFLSTVPVMNPVPVMDILDDGRNEVFFKKGVLSGSRIELKFIGIDK